MPTLRHNGDFVHWFRQSSPYIHAHRGKVLVLGFGGETLTRPDFPNLIHDIALLDGLGIKLVLAPGARPQIEERLALRGADMRIVNGLRVTDADALECVKDAAGSVRVEIEALLSMGLANSPMAGTRIRVLWQPRDRTPDRNPGWRRLPAHRRGAARGCPGHPCAPGQ